MHAGNDVVIIFIAFFFFLYSQIVVGNFYTIV